MANLRIENQFITAVITEQLPITNVLRANFETTWLSHNADIWDWILNYYQTNNKLPSKELLETRYPAFIEDTVKDNPNEILDALREGSEGDRLNDDINEAVVLLRKGKNVKGVISFLQNQLEKYGGAIEQDVFDLASDDDLALLIKKYRERKTKLETTGYIGIPTGFGTEMDTWLNGGLQNGNLYGVLAPLGVGKTWTANIIAASALQHGFSPFILALEGTLEKEGYRSLTTTTEISNSRLHTATVSDMELEASMAVLKRKAAKFNGHYYLALHGNREAYTLSTLRQNVIKYNPDIVIVDYLALMATLNSKGADDWAAVQELSRGLKRLAVSLDKPVVSTLQGNRASSMAEFLTANESSNYGPLRDFDGVIGITKDKNLIRVGDVKGRDTMGTFRAYYQTDWDKGRVKFLKYAEEDDGTF